jgi:hypothetical protein
MYMKNILIIITLTTGLFFNKLMYGQIANTTPTGKTTMDVSASQSGGSNTNDNPITENQIPQVNTDSPFNTFPDVSDSPLNTDACSISLSVVNECLSGITKQSGYKFFIDSETGRLMYGDESDPETAEFIDCIEFCPTLGNIANVLSVQANVLTNEWEYDEEEENKYEINASTGNPFEIGARGKWRVKENYTYATDITQFHEGHEVYESGMFKNFRLYDRDDEYKNTEWLKTNTITSYSPSGEALEEQDILENYSAIKFGYGTRLPYMVAQNAEYSAMLFESFEYISNEGAVFQNAEDISVYSVGMNNMERVSDTAHSGSYSARINGWTKSGTTAYVSSQYIAQDMTLSEQLKENGLSVKLWVYNASGGTLTLKLLLLNESYQKLNTISFTKMAQTGQWQLYALELKDENNTSSSSSVWKTLSENSKFHLKLWAQLKPAIGTNSLANTNVYIDDVRIQPLDAQAVCYVYDINNNRLLTQFDDQHFGNYYQYNAEGKLIRKIRETEKGVKTLQESHYHIATEESESYNPGTIDSGNFQIKNK